MELEELYKQYVESIKPEDFEDVCNHISNIHKLLLQELENVKLDIYYLSIRSFEEAIEEAILTKYNLFEMTEDCFLGYNEDKPIFYIQADEWVCLEKEFKEFEKYLNTLGIRLELY